MISTASSTISIILKQKEKIIADYLVIPYFYCKIIHKLEFKKETKLTKKVRLFSIIG